MTDSIYGQSRNIRHIALSAAAVSACAASTPLVVTGVGALVTGGVCWGAVAGSVAGGALALGGLAMMADGASHLPRRESLVAPHQAPKTPNQLNKDIHAGRAPKSIARVDTPKVVGEQLHNLAGGRHALNIDGTWKHSGRKLTSAEKKWLSANGWKLPKE